MTKIIGFDSDKITGGTPASPVGGLQYNNSGAFGGASTMLWSSANGRLQSSLDEAVDYNYFNLSRFQGWSEWYVGTGVDGSDASIILTDGTHAVPTPIKGATSSWGVTIRADDGTVQHDIYGDGLKSVVQWYMQGSQTFNIIPDNGAGTTINWVVDGNLASSNNRWGHSLAFTAEANNNAGNGGDIILNGGAKASSHSDGNVILANSRGFVGVGTASPTATLHISTAGSSSVGGSGSDILFGGTALGSYNGVMKMTATSRGVDGINSNIGAIGIRFTPDPTNGNIGSPYIYMDTVDGGGGTVSYFIMGARKNGTAYFQGPTGLVIESSGGGPGTLTFGDTNSYGVLTDASGLSTNDFKFGDVQGFATGHTLVLDYLNSGDAWFAGGNVGFGGNTSPTAKIHIGAGSASASTAPIKLTSGTLMSTPEVGAIEYLTDLPYFTKTTGTTRGVVDVSFVTRLNAKTAAQASVAAFTPPSDGSFIISANVLVTTATAHNFTVTCAYTDEGNTARTATLSFSTVAGVLGTAIINTAGAVPYEGVPLHIRAKGGTSITIATTGTFTTVTYNVEGSITQIA